MMDHQNIEILRVTHLRGPNIWTYRPVIEAWVDIGDLENYPSNTIDGFYERFTALLPSLVEHHCSPGVRGGFLQRVREGTYAAHILEHTTLELQNLAGMRTGFGKARQSSKHGVYKIAFRTRQEQVGRQALAAARELVLAAINNTPYDINVSVDDTGLATYTVMVGGMWVIASGSVRYNGMPWKRWMPDFDRSITTYFLAHAHSSSRDYTAYLTNITVTWE